MPACGDSVIIQAAHTISVTSQQNYSSCGSPLKVVVYGALNFFNGFKLSLPCGSYIIVTGSGLIMADVGFSNSNYIEICNDVVWNSNTIVSGNACFPLSHPICSSSAVLPIELTYFVAQTCKYNEICFNWETSSEFNNNHFEVERSTNAFDFKVVLSINSKAPNGNSYSKISYSGIDEAPINGINYYRLKQVDNNQVFKYSKIISVHLVEEKELQFLIFPNSNPGEFTAKITGLKNSESVNVILRDQTGSVVYKALHQVDETFTKIKVNPPFKLSSGFYYCSFIIGDSEHVVKVIVAK